MAIQLTERNSARILEVQLGSKLIHETYQHFVPELERLVTAHARFEIQKAVTRHMLIPVEIILGAKT